MRKVELTEDIIYRSTDSISDRRFNKLHQLIEAGRKYSVSRRQVIQSSDDRYRPLINLVKSGYVKRYEIGDDGSLSIQAIYEPGDIFPITLAFKSIFNMDIYEGPEVIYYESISDAELCSLDINNLVHACLNDATIYRDLLLETGIKMQSNIQRLENFSLKNSYQRTAHQLVYFARQFGEKNRVSIHISVALTHQDIADVMSLTRETVSINLHKLQQKGVIKTGRFIEIIDFGELQRIAYHTKDIPHSSGGQLAFLK